MSKVILQVRHHVEDFNRWLPVFEEHQAVRQQHGAAGHRLYRSAEDPNDVVIINEFDSIEGARAFAQDPSLPETMHRAGVDSAPVVTFLEEAEVAAYR